MGEILVCLADRKIQVIHSTGGVEYQYLAIQAVNGKQINPISVVGEANSAREIIQNCGRCVGSGRKCDLSMQTKSDLAKQST